MSPRPIGLLARPALGRRIAWVVLVAGLCLSAWAWVEARQNVVEDAQAQFRFDVSQISHAIQRRMEAYEQVLRGGVGLVYADEELTREDWRIYVERLQLARNFPGIQGMGLTVYLRPDQVAPLERRLQRQGFPGFQVWPGGERDVYTAIVFLEPFDWRNQRAFGYDMFSEPTRRAAMAKARDTGRTTVTGKVTLVQETDEAPQAGFLMYLPVYRGEVVPETIAERREQLVGFVYSPFRMADLMEGILGGGVLDLSLNIYDGTALGADSLMYSSHPAPAEPAFESVEEIGVNGHIWTLLIRSRPGVEAEMLAEQEPLLVLLSGSLLSLLLFGLVWGMASIQRRAVLLADTMTAAFRRSEAKYCSLAQAALDAIVIADDEGRIVSWNRGASEIFGYAEEAVLGRPWTLVLPERLREGYGRALRLAGEDADPRVPARVLQLTGVRQSGEEFPMELSLARWGEDEHFFSGIIRDVTERKRAEDALRLSEERFRVALKGADITVFSQDRALRYTWVYNPPLGMEEGEMLGRDDEALIPGHPSIALKRRVIETGEPVHERLEFGRDGKREFFDLVLEPVWERGVVVGLSGAAVNITALKRTEQELRASEARFRTTFESAAIGIVVSDAEDRIIEANRALQQMLGRGLETLRGQYLSEYVHPADAIGSGTVLEMLSRQEQVKHQKRYRRADGRFLWGSLTASAVRDEQGRPQLVIRMIEDITELKAAQEALDRAYRDLERRVDERTRALRQQAQELARSNAELEQFAYVASHDLQEPLRSVSAFAQLLERRHAAQLGEEGRQFLGFIVEGTGRMRQLIVDLLAYSRVGSEEKPFASVELESVLAQTLENLSAMLAERHARVEHEPLPVVHGDAVDLLQLLQNLIGNGIKFNRSPAPMVWVRVRDQGEAWRFEVQDNGIGIEPVFFERIFTLFQRGVRPEEYAGTGIGLAICKKVVERHGGRIWVESAPGQGSTFYFTLKKPPSA